MSYVQCSARLALARPGATWSDASHAAAAQIDRLSEQFIAWDAAVTQAERAAGLRG
jgi:hypothetical protein